MFVSQVVYGLRLAANKTLPGLAFLPNATAFDVRIHLEEQGFPRSSTSDKTLYTSSDPGKHQPNLIVGTLQGGEYFGFFYGDGARFAVERRGREVWVNWPENHTLEDACTYLLGPVAGFVLRLRGVVCLHASAVAVGDHAIALVGLPGAGKSTTAAAFACAGYPVLSDDVVALSDKGVEFLVEPGYPRVNLWPDSACALFGSAEALPRITPSWDKRYLPLEDGHCFASKPLPLGAIFILDRRDSSLTAPEIAEVPGKEGFVTLVANTYVNYLLDRDMRRREFDVLGRVVSEIPVRRVRPRAEPSAIFSVSEAIAADAKRVLTRHPATAAAVAG